MDINQAFAILGVGPNAPAEQVRRAYRRMVKRWHPDQFGHDPGIRADAEARLKTINQAYAVLKNHLKTNPAPTAAEPRKEGADQQPKHDFGHRFRAAFNFAGRFSTPPEPDPQPKPRATPQPSPRQPAGDFQEALNAAGSGYKSFKQAPVPPNRPNRTSQRLKPPSKPRSRSTRVEPVEPISRIRPVAPISRIGDGE